MNLAEPASHPEHEIEGLLTALSGVLAARVSLGHLGRVEEIHILADTTAHPKQMVRNVESALSAGLGITVDRRVVSVAQVRSDDALDEEAPRRAAVRGGPTRGAADSPDPQRRRPRQACCGPAPASAAAAAPAGSSSWATTPGRSRTWRPPAGSPSAANEVFSGTGTGPSTMLGRAQAAARAVFAAIAAARRDHSLGLEGVTLVESHGRDFVLVAAHAVHGRSTVPLTGIAALLTARRRRPRSSRAAGDEPLERDR
jgi:hypothetical protein